VKHSRLWLFSLFLSLSLSSADAADCKLQKAASFDIKPDSNMLMVKAKIEDKEVWAALDTGSPFNMIDNKLVEELKLQTNHSYLSAVDAAGRETAVTATAHKVKLGDFVGKNLSFLIGGRNGDGFVPALFGANFLEKNGIDVELDIAHGKVNIFLSDHCRGIGAYWAHEYVPIPIRVQKDGHIYLPVTLDGLETHALLDTGSSRTLVDKRVAEGSLGVQANVEKDRPNGHLVAGSGTGMPYYEHVFKNFDIGGIAFHNTEFAVTLDHINYLNVNRSNDPHITLREEEVINAPIVLGLQHLSKLRMYLSFDERMLYVTPANAQ
jgi:predicted aspartyl protease